MPNLRSMIDGTTIFAGAAKASKPSPAAQQTAGVIQDPVGTTKDDFQDLQQKKLDYDTARSNMQLKLIGPQAVLDHVNQTHGLNNDNPDVDEFGNPIDPNNPMATGQQAPAVPGKGMPGQQPGKPAMPGMPGAPQAGTRGLPGTSKMGQPGAGAPPTAMPGTPGMAPSMGQKRPPQMGMPTPGAPTTTGAPQPKGSAGNAAKPAAKPAAKKDKQIKVHVTASDSRDSRDSSRIRSSASTLESQLGYGTMKAGKVMHSGASIIQSDKDKVIKMCQACNKMHAGSCVEAAREMDAAKVANSYRMPHDTSDASDKDTDHFFEKMRDNMTIKVNPVTGKIEPPTKKSDMAASAGDDDCEDECDGDQDCIEECQDADDDVDCGACDEMAAAGNTDSAIKGWGTRGRGNPMGHASEKELKAHKTKMKKMKSGGPGSGRYPTSQHSTHSDAKQTARDARKKGHSVGVVPSQNGFEVRDKSQISTIQRSRINYKAGGPGSGRRPGTGGTSSPWTKKADDQKIRDRKAQQKMDRASDKGFKEARSHAPNAKLPSGWLGKVGMRQFPV